MISRRRLRLLIALMLPVLALRALLPVGYMASADADGLRIVLCSDGIAALSTPAGHDHGQDRDHGAPAGGNDCPFAHALLNAPPPHVVAVALAPTPQFNSLPSAPDDLPPAAGPPRASGARAPPPVLA